MNEDELNRKKKCIQMCLNEKYGWRKEDVWETCGIEKRYFFICDNGEKIAVRTGPYPVKEKERCLKIV